MQEVEQQYKEGSIKHMLVAVLKAVQPEALTTQGEDAQLAATQARHACRLKSLCACFTPLSTSWYCFSSFPLSSP